MADYHSSLTGPDIDAALTRAKSGGTIDIALAGKAPNGYGIGEEYATLVRDTDLNTLKNGGTYYIGTGCTNTPPGTDSSWSTLHVIPGRACTQIFIPANDANRAGTFSSWIARIYNNATAAWGAWEWVNPPMAAGVEYRTTERYLGKPVYCMTKFVGEVAANTVAQVIINDSDIGKYCIRAFCTGKRTFGNWLDDTTTMVSSPAGSDTIITCDPTVYRLNEGHRSIRAYIKSSVSLKDVYCTAYYTKWAD